MDNTCPVCGSQKINYYLEKNSFKYNKCDDCNLVFLEKIPEDLEKYYSEGYFTGDLELDGYVDYESEKELTRVSFEKYLDFIENHIKEKNRLLEVGCATGYFLDLAKKRGWNTKGVDISKYAVEEALKKGHDVICSKIEDLHDDDNLSSHDVVVMLDALEHLTSPKQDLKKMSNFLKPDGLFVFSTPDSSSLWSKVWGRKWHAFVPPQHIHVFSSENVRFLLEDVGLEVKFVGHYGKNFSLPYIFRLLNTWTKMKIWFLLAKFTSKHGFLKKITIPINLGDTMFVIAQKVK